MVLTERLVRVHRLGVPPVSDPDFNRRVPMQQDRDSQDSEAVRRFFDRCQKDRDFYRLAFQDTPAALAAVGFRVPGGVSIRMAPDAASALDIALAGASNARVANGELDDAQLELVTGGVVDGDGKAAVQRVLDLLIRSVLIGR